MVAVRAAPLAWGLLLAPSAQALDPDKRLTQYLHTSWRTQDASAPGAMFTITQTADGFLWFSSLREIYRFDGMRFLPWRPALENPATGLVTHVVGDRSDGLWAIGNTGIAHIKGGSVLSHFELEGLLWFGDTTVDADGSLWVVRGRNVVSDAPLCQITDHAVKCYGKSDGLAISPADALLPDGSGGFWIGGQTSVVHWRDGISQTYPIDALRANAGNNGVTALAHGRDGSLWVGILAEGRGLGLGRLRDGVFAPFVTPTFDGSTVAVYAMIVDRQGALWVATSDSGILRIHGNVVDQYRRTDGLSNDTVFALHEDREGIVWAATASGIDSFRDPRITTFSVSEGLGRDAATGVLATRDGAIWVANSGSLDRIANGAVSSIRRKDGLPGSQVSSLLEDRAGNLWVGVDDGLYLFKGGRFRRLPEPEGQPLGLVVGMTEDVEGNIWAACAGRPRKLVRIRDFQVREEFPVAQIPPAHNLAADPQGGIWIGALNGDLLRLRQGVVEKFAVQSKGNPVSHQIVVEDDGSVLAAYEDGLVGLRQGTLRRMTKANGLPCDSVISFIQDEAKRWWLYTDCGVVELPDSELRRWWADPGAVVRTRHYDVLDGAQPNSPSFNSAAHSPDGRIWFATGVVVQMVDPPKLIRQAMPALTYVEVVTVDRQTFAPAAHLRLPATPRDLQIDYTSPTLLIPQRVKFRYRLEGYETDWHEAGTRRQAFYTDLPPGDYSFRVVASNSDGVWSDSPGRLDFFVTPAYYQTTWFRGLAGVGFLALLWAASHARTRQVRRRFEMTLDARVAERTRIARELHDTLLQSFHGLLLRFQTASYLLPDRPAEARGELDGAIQQAAQAITTGRDAVQGLRASTIERNDLALAISTLGRELTPDASARRADVRVAVEGESRELHPIVRDEIYKVAAEALRNAFRHAQAGKLEVDIRYSNDEFRLRVRDDGKGIDREVLASRGIEGHYGLRGMTERAELIGGKLAVWSEVGAGTEVELRLPARTVYATSRRRTWWSRLFAPRTPA